MVGPLVTEITLRIYGINEIVASGWGVQYQISRYRFQFHPTWALQTSFDAKQHL
jgi:hypothetical protein